MNKLTAILLSLFISLSATAQQAFDALTTIRETTDELVASLRASGCKTVAAYYVGSAACPASATGMAIIYWERNRQAFAAVLKESRFNNDGRLKRHLYNYCHKLPHRYPLSFLDSNYMAIVADSTDRTCRAKDGKEIYIMNYQFEKLTFFSPSKNLTCSFPTNCRTNYSNSFAILFTDNFLNYIATNPDVLKDIKEMN